MTRLMINSGFRPWLVLMMVGLGCALTTPAEGQGRGMQRGGWGGGRVSMYYLRRDLPLIADQLQLDTSQRTIVDVLLLDSIDQFDTISEKMRERMDALRTPRTPEQEKEREVQRTKMRESFREMRDLRRTLRDMENTGAGRDVSPEIAAKLQDRLTALQTNLESSRQAMFQSEEMQQLMDGMAAINREWKAERDKLEVQFETDVQMLLNEDQQNLWPGMERKLRRIKTMGRGRISGERVDLFLLLQDLGIETDKVEDLPPVLVSYALELDAALVARNNHIEHSTEARSQAFRNQDSGLITALAQKEASLRVRVRNVNEQYVEAVAGALEALEQNEEFRSAFRNKAFARIFRRTPMQRTFAAVLKFDDLDPETLEAVQGLEEMYLSELIVMNDSLVQVTRREEPKRLATRGGRGMGRRQEQPEDPIRVAFFARNEMDFRYREQLDALLSEEQVARLPEMKRPEQNRRRGGMTERMAELDRNGDGKIQRNEVPEPMQRFFDRVDGNKDGAIDEKEIESFFSNRRRGNQGGENRSGRGQGGGNRGGGLGNGKDSRGG